LGVCRDLRLDGGDCSGAVVVLSTLAVAL